MSKVSANLPTASASAGGQQPSRHPMATGAAPQQPMPGMLPPQSPSAGTTAAGGVIHMGMTAEGIGSAAQPSPSTGAAQQNMANPKEKTPMCLLNELARYNKLIPLYELADENGPAHEKTFLVRLTLGQHKYEANGTSIKKAQHTAADQALQTCGLPKPKPRAPKPQRVGIPNFQLNSFALKHGIPVEYTILDPGNAPGPRYPQYGYAQQQGPPGPGPHGPGPHQGYSRPSIQGGQQQQHDGMPPQQTVPPPGQGPMYHGGHGGRGPRYPGPFRTAYVKVTIGNREFIGEGRIRKDAKQDAAAKALKSFEDEPLPPREESLKEVVNPIKKEGDAKDNDQVKSDISMVYETAHNHNLGVAFKVIEEQGPPHMKNFKVQCIVGEFVTVGEGNSKKNAKRRAAEAMMASLRTLATVVKPERPRGRYPVTKKKKNKSLIQTRASNPEYGAPGLNPISRLVQILQAKKEKEPVFSVTEERGVVERSGRQVLRRREFTMQVSTGTYTCTGKGSNKKNAKRAAAEEMLRTMGYNTVLTPTNPNAAPNKSALKNIGQNDDGSERKVTFEDPLKKGGKDQPIIPGTKLAPGLLPMMPGVTGPNYGGDQTKSNGMNRAPGAPIVGQKPAGIPPVTAEIARDMLRMGHSLTADNISKSTGNMPDTKLGRPKQQLEYLARVQGLKIQFTDFPKQGGKAEFLSLVSVSTEPQLVSHGAGPTMEASHDVAAVTALRSLAGFNQEEDGQAVINQGGRNKKVGNKH